LFGFEALGSSRGGRILFEFELGEPCGVAGAAGGNSSSGDNLRTVSRERWLSAKIPEWEAAVHCRAAFTESVLLCYNKATMNKEKT